MLYVCMSWILVLHMAGTQYNSLDSLLSLSFNSKDSGVYCSQLFYMLHDSVYIKLH